MVRAVQYGVIFCLHEFVDVCCPIPKHFLFVPERLQRRFLLINATGYDGQSRGQCTDQAAGQAACSVLPRRLPDGSDN